MDARPAHVVRRLGARPGPARAAARAAWSSVLLDDEVIGHLYLHVEDAWSQVEVRDQAERRPGRDRLGRSTRAHQGQGYATEAVRELLRVCFEDLGVRRVVALAFADNAPSLRVHGAGRHAPRGAHRARSRCTASSAGSTGCCTRCSAEEWRQLPLTSLSGLRRGQRGRGRLVALVLDRALEAGAVERLLLGVAGEQAEADRDAVVERDPAEPVGGRVADVVEVRGAAADDDAERDDGVVPLLGEAPARPPAARRRRARGPRSRRDLVVGAAPAAAPASSPSITCVCQLAATTATRRSLRVERLDDGRALAAHWSVLASASSVGRRGRAGRGPSGPAW